jgi:outer membrane lipoprotein-sorting protein
VNILRRLPLSRLLLACALVVAVGVSATALASALGSGPTPPPKALPLAVHDALVAPPVEGVSATVQLSNHVLEGANIASGDGSEASQLSASPLLSGASGRLWIAKDGRARLELESEKGDTEVLYDGHTAELYDASTNTLYRYRLPSGSGAGTDTGDTSESGHEAPSLAKIEEAIAHLRKHAEVSEATPTDVAGQAAYTVRISPDEPGSLFGGVELSWDAVHGVPLRAAVYSSTSSSPVIELAAREISYGPVDSSVFSFTPPPGATLHEITTSSQQSSSSSTGGQDQTHPKVTTRGKGPATIAIVESAVSGGGKQHTQLSEELPKVNINGISATELATPLGTLLSFERSGVRYLLAGSVTPSDIEAVARGL